MKTLKKLLRLFATILWLLLASTGLGIGAVLTTKERQLDREIKEEQVDKKNDEGDELG